MGFFDKYPYTDFHEINLDWFLKMFKNVVNEFDSLSEQFTTLKEYVDDYFNNPTVQAAVDRYFEGLIDSGRFFTLLNTYFGNDLVNDSLYTLKAQVVADRSDRWNANYTSQGFCIGKMNGRDVAMTAFIDQSNGNYYDDNIIVWTYMDTGLVAAQATTACGHANSCAYNSDTGNWYIACAGGVAPYDSQRKTLMEIDSSGNIIKEELIGNACWAVTYNKGKIYALLDGSRLAVIDASDWTKINIITGFIEDSDFTYQGMFSDDLYLYVPNGNRITAVAQNKKNLNRISVYTHTGLLVKNINMLFPLEIEEGDILDGVCYISANTARVGLICTADLYMKNRNNCFGFINENIEVNEVQNTIYVDETYADFLVDGSSDHPLSSLSWMLLWLKNSVSRLNINVVSDVVSLTKLSVRKFQNAVLNIDFNGHIAPNMNVRCEQLYLNNLIMPGMDNEFSIEYHGSRLVINNITFGTVGSTVVPDRFIFTTSAIEITGVTIEQQANMFMYLIGGGYLRNLVCNITHVFGLFMTGIVNVSANTDTTIFKPVSIDLLNTTSLLVNDQNRTIDVHAVRYPTTIVHAGGTLTNIPAGVTLSQILNVEITCYRITNNRMKAIYYLNNDTEVIEHFQF